MPTFNEYQEFTNTTAKYSGKGTVAGLVYATLGVTGEAGEIANKTKKILRDAGGVLTEETRLKLIDEVSDVLWYVSQLCSELDVSMEKVAEHNISKLTSRLERGTIQGSGDNR